MMSALMALCVVVPGGKPEAFALRDAWLRDHFAEPGAPRESSGMPRAGVLPLINYGKVQWNGRDGLPLRIADRTFAQGFYCHAPSRVAVRLFGPGRKLAAVVGGETNGNYSGGTMVFTVSAGGKELYRSPVMPRGAAGIPISVDLGGARSIVLGVEDAGDGNSSDQACWGDPVVEYENGASEPLGKLPDLSARTRIAPPFSFYLGDATSDELLWSWGYHKGTKKLSPKQTQITYTYRQPGTGFEARAVAVVYEDFPTVEWTLYLRNGGKKDSPIVSGVRGLDVDLACTRAKLHHFVGALAAPNDYEPRETVLKPGATATITTAGGRPTNSNLPYFNLETGGGGVIAALSWAGQWSADFQREGNRAEIRAGQEQTYFRLHPGEEVRAPLAVLQFYKGDWIEAQNVWRRWMFAHNVPKVAKPMLNLCMGNNYPGIITNAAEELGYLKRYVEEKMKPDFWWQDAGWYKCGDPPSWTNTGTWEVEPKRWPKGIREVSDWGHAHGIRTIVWFEPERVAAGSWLADNRPQWILGGKNGGLLNLGDPKCRHWITDRIDSILKDQGIALYRQDFNIDPLGYWRANDAPDRMGITEIRYVEGYHSFWDELLRRHPGMLIDSCASGGRRNDLETLRRAVPLLRSDYTFEPVGEQCHTYGISFWMPFNGTGVITLDPYLIRSAMGPSFTIGVDIRDKSKDWSPLRKLLAERANLAKFFYGDYYPLTPWSGANDVWMAWQFDRSDLGSGMVQAFRRGDCASTSLIVKLRGLAPGARYEVRNLDGGTPVVRTGKQLMAGFTVTALEKPAALVLRYRALPHAD